jgi:hypothetical protein
MCFSRFLKLLIPQFHIYKRMSPKLLMPVLFALKKPRHQSLFPDMKKPGSMPGSLLLPAVRLSRFILSSLAFLQFLTSLLLWYPLIFVEDTLLLLWR